ncbi:MAG: pantoate--beta-alanine ligase [Bacteroidales bacterium]|nr:pantoate--beta-alanine ligase [Bacteroidales bacterium]
MVLIQTVDELKTVIFRIKSSGKSIGLVPTMGALHKGHMSLLKKARSENEVLVCSIFVNPVQFNNKEDLEKYPRTLEKDVEFIKDVVDIVFAPTPEDVYPEAPTEQYDFGALGSVMEGAWRPGHFNGVATIVGRLFQWVQPEKAYFGEKDFQQLAIIREMVRQKNFPVEVIGCPAVREENGLAVSSRNQRLSAEEQQIASNIYRILQEAKKRNTLPVSDIKAFVTNEIEKIKEFKLEYFEIADAKTLQPVNEVVPQTTIACIALSLGGVRLIDEILL